MSQLIYFGGRPKAKTKTPYQSLAVTKPDPQIDYRVGIKQTDPDPTMDFYRYVSTVWAHVPGNASRVETLSPADQPYIGAEFLAYLRTGRRLPTRGITLEEGWIASKLIYSHPEICLINSEQPPQPTHRIERKMSLPPQQLVFGLREMAQRYPPAHLNDLRPPHMFLTFDGKTGHCMDIRGYDNTDDAFIYWDSWPGRSLLCSENNRAGASARLQPAGAGQWLLSLEDMAKVVFAVFVPVAQWQAITQSGVLR